MSKRYKKNLALVKLGKKYATDEAFEVLSKFEGAKFDETINLAVRLGVDTTKADQQIRGATVLPNGVGKKNIVLVFAKGAKATEAQECGADFVGAEDLVEKINGGWMDFDKVIATPDMMLLSSKLGKVLGPRGVMPNPKTGTVTMDVKRAIEEERKGKVEFRAEKAGIVQVPIGKKSFGPQKLKENFNSFMDVIIRLKPSSSKGSYVRSVTVASTMGPGIRLEPNQFSG
jgi:large subunit ribosomal protein L1